MMVRLNRQAFERGRVFLKAQTTDGAWETNWSWGSHYPEAWEQARREWRGHLALETLTSLRAFGRIDT